MDDIIVLGCSFSAGNELYDPYIIKDYDNLRAFVGLETKDFVKKNEEFYMKILQQLSHEEYAEKCIELAWPAKLQNDIKRQVKNFSVPGVGISYYKNIVVSDLDNVVLDSHTEKITSLKNDIYTTDILIWQLTFEPRYCIKFEKYLVYGVLKDLVSENIEKYDKIPKWKRKIFSEYYKYCIDEQEYFRDNIQFFENVLLKRAKNKKHTVIFSFREAFVNHEFKEKSIGYPIIENEYIHYRNNPNDGGILDEYFGKEVYTHQMLFGHPDEYTHKRVAEDMKNYMKEKGII